MSEKQLNSMSSSSSRTISSGQQATFVKDNYVQGALQLFVDGTPQSHINVDDPSQLFFEYVHRIGNAIDQVTTPGKPITALHLGGGAYTLPRYIDATRPGSKQQIIEIDDLLVDFVRETVPLPKRSAIRVRRGDARERLAFLPKGMHGTVDVIVVDVFSGATTPAHLTSQEFYSELLPFLHPESLVLVNAADGPGLQFVRGQVATLMSVFKNVAATSQTQVLRGKRFGNVVLIAASASTSKQVNSNWSTIISRMTSAGPHPAVMLQKQELTAFVANAKPVTDVSAIKSPTPPKSIFKV